ncbi:transferase family-domain-containing protein [Emericellopsis atlantica]|uniref:Transferase family-domain-containing protein n=1 Tax=Emericellopsis atlantica TaxID=2614577 RepID=A0A9P7ZFZ6_9HYPO|nr:transferase family-domain-containing protein [Emericellopsis atlantica]KAG9250773.1 transferase family-domain-containing protein [Emericellopsis atlantica]
MSQTLRQPGIFGQLCWDTYTVLILGFADQPGTTRDDNVATLDKAALKVFDAYPSLAGQVIKTGISDTNSGKYEIVPYPPHQNKSPVLSKDCTALCPSYAEIAAADAPFAMLDGDVLCPVKGMGYQYELGAELPVFLVQANFVEGGVLLCFASMHNALDMNGQGTVLKMFAAAGRGEELDADLVAVEQRDADTIVPLLKEGEAPANHDSMRRPSALAANTGPSTEVKKAPKPAIWTYWRFSAQQLEGLKKEASSGRTWVSTNDAITAFLVQRLTATRIAEGRVSKNELVQLQRAVDSRSVVKPAIGEGYLGHLVALADKSWKTAEEVATSSFADVAVDVRESLKAVDDHFIRSLVTLIKNTEDKTTIFYGAGNKAGRDFLCSSWAQLHWLNECSFGKGLGSPDFVRRARMAPVPDLTYIMPKNKKGDMYVATSLFHEDFVGLANDDGWRARAKLVG